MSESQIMDNFIILTGLSPESALPYQPLCRASLEKVMARLGSWVDTQKNQDRISMAAAADAAYVYLLTQASGGNFRLGELSVEDERLGEVESLKELMERYIGDLLDQGTFAFLEVGE